MGKSGAPSDGTLDDSSESVMEGSLEGATLGSKDALVVGSALGSTLGSPEEDVTERARLTASRLEL